MEGNGSELRATYAVSCMLHKKICFVVQERTLACRPLRHLGVDWRLARLVASNTVKRSQYFQRHGMSSPVEGQANHSVLSQVTSRAFAVRKLPLPVLGSTATGDEKRQFPDTNQPHLPRRTLCVEGEGSALRIRGCKHSFRREYRRIGAEAEPQRGDREAHQA